MAHSHGLSFKKIDLHVHTPTSTDYRGGKPSPDEIVARAKQQGLDAIAVTDHQTAAAVDALKEAGRKAGLVVFPGVELMVVGGERGVHINLIFDVDKGMEHIHQFLNTVGVYEKDGKPTVAAAEITVGMVADKLAVYDPTALIVLAHCHSSKGVTGDIKGTTRTQIFQQHRRNIMAAEASEGNFLDEQKRKDGTRVLDIFNGENEDYGFRRLGVIRASDAHSLDEMGADYSLFKVDDPLTIEDLRQCFIDRDTRIRQSFEFKPTTYPKIESMVVTSGFLKDQAFQFHEGLNSILGAKGSGKSLAIEALRFALDQSPTMSPMREDHLAKLEKCVKPYGEVRVAIVDDSGKRHIVTRTFSDSDGSPTTIVDASDGASKEFSVAEVFPVLFLSQNEIIRIAEDASGASLRAFIDRFFDFHHHQHQIAQLTTELERADRRAGDSLRAHTSLSEARRKAATLKEAIEQLNRQFTSSTFDKYALNEGIGLALKAHSAFIATLDREVEELLQEQSDRPLPVSDDARVTNDAAVKRAAAASASALIATRERLAAARAELQKGMEAVANEYRAWEAGFAPLKAEYEALVKQAGGNRGALDQRRRKLVTDLASLERQIATYAAKASLLKAAFEARREILNRMDAAYKDYYNERRERCAYFTEQSRGAIEVTIAEGRDFSQFKSKLMGVKKGSYLRDDEVDQIAQALTPRELVSAALNYEYGGRIDKKSIDELASKSGLKRELLDRLISHMLSEMLYEDVMALMYETAPQDVPEIKYEVSGSMKPLSELSVGQKASALLIVGLSDGNFPIVIDQPEDSLDLRSIWDDVCHTLRDSKDRRQFVFTTHNSSVAVASDSDKFTILQAGATQATVLHSGSINSKDVRAEVIAYLEGGPTTYDKKREKYNLDKRPRD